MSWLPVGKMEVRLPGKFPVGSLLFFSGGLSASTNVFPALRFDAVEDGNAVPWIYWLRGERWGDRKSVV